MFISLLALMSCVDSRTSCSLLYMAESQMQASPAEALSSIKAVEPSTLYSRKSRAKYALLYSQALDRTGVDTTSDSLISVALKYYKRRGATDDRAKAFYYSGRVYENMGNCDSAIIQYTVTDELLRNSTNLHLKGLTANALGRMYESQNYAEIALAKYLSAAETFLQNNDKKNALRSYIRALDMCYIQGDSEIYQQYFSTTLSLAEELRDTMRILSLNKSKAVNVIHVERDYNAALEILNNAVCRYNNGQYPCHYYFDLVRIFVNIGQLDRALEYIDRIRSNPNISSRLNLELEYLLSQIYRDKNNFAKAYKHSCKALSICDSLYFAEKNHVIPELQERYRNDILRQHNEYLERREQYQLIITVVSILLSLFVVLWIINWRKNYILEKERQILEYREMISQMKSEYENIRGYREQLLSDEMISRHIEFLKRILETTAYHKGDKESYASKMESILTKCSTAKELKCDNANEILRIIQDLINIKHPGIIDYLRGKYASLSNMELSLLCMIVLNISKPAICLVMNISCKTYYNYRNILRHRLRINSYDTTIEQHYRDLCAEFDAKNRTKNC